MPAVLVTIAAPASAYTKPDTTTSVYEHDVSTTNLQNQALTQAANARSGLVILDFGRPAYNVNNGGSGTLDFGGHEDSFASIIQAVEAYATAWYNAVGTAPHLDIAFGINNSYTVHSGSCSSGCSYLPTDLYRYGQQFGTTVNSIESFVSSRYSAQEVATAADDAEPAFDPEYTDTDNVLNGYNNTGSYAVYDYGSLESGYWSNGQELKVAFGGTHNLSVPEIYYTSQATEWENLVLYARSVGSGMFISGVMTEQPSSGTLTYQGAYDAMMSALASHANTAQSSIRYSTNIS